MTNIEKKLVEINNTKQAIYEDTVNTLVRQKYSLSNELAILRQRDDKPEEYDEYCDYVEQCKVQAKEIIAAG